MQLLIENALNNIDEATLHVVQESSFEIAEQMVDASWGQSC